MSAQPPNRTSVENLDLLPQRQLTIASLVPALLWRRLVDDEAETLPLGDFTSSQAVIGQLRLYGPANPQVLNELSANVPSVMAVAYNTFYAYLVNALTRVGGHIVELTMHHLTVIFPIGESQRGSQVFQALTGIENAIALARDKTPPGYPNIHWHASAGVSYGQVNTAIVGNEFLGRKHLLVGGTAKMQAEDALDFARRGQVVVHREVFKPLATVPPGEWLDEQFFLSRESYSEGELSQVFERRSTPLPATRAGTPPSSLLQTHRLAAFLDPRIRTRPPFIPLQRGQFTETLTCLTLHLIGMGLPDEYAVERWQKAIEEVFDIAARFGGLIDHVTTELGIGEIRIVFGLPEDQLDVERRAARCALALNRTLAAIDPHLRIGLATGPGFAALLGTRFYSNYVVISPAIDTARQLAGRAEAREILSDTIIQKATANLFAWRQQKSSLPGQGPVFALAGEVSLDSGLAIRRQATRDQPVVGRTTERETLAGHVARAQDGQGQLLLITGQTGHGRSTLIDEVIAAWLADDGNGFVSLGPTYSPSTPYALWRPIWRTIFDLQLEEPVPSKLRKLSRSFSRILPDADGGVALFANLLGLSTDDEASLHYLPPSVRRRRLFDATRTLLSQLAAISPLLLVFEHTEFSDTPSLELLDELARTLTDQPILFCVEDRRLPEHSLRKVLKSATPLTAQPLTSAEAWQLLEAHLPAALDWPYSFRNRLVKLLGDPDETTTRQHAPAQVAALAAALRHDFIVRKGDRWQLNPDRTAHDIPSDEPEAVGWLLTHVLSERERDIITRAAASGIHFPHHASWLAAPHGGGSATVEIERLEGLGLVQRYLDSGAGGRWSRFRHEAIREALYAQLDVQTRIDLHRAIIDWYKAHLPGQAMMATAAAHAERAGLSAEAVHAYLKAAAFAIDWGATSEAMQCLLAAERHLAHTPESHPDLLRDLALTRANLYIELEQYANGLAEAQKALTHAQAIDDWAGVCRSLLYMARVAGHDDDRQTMLDASSRALALAQELDDPRLITEATWLRANALMTTGKRREAVQMLLHALEEGDIDNDELELEMRLDVVRILLVDHYRERANEHVQRLHEQAASLDNPVLQHQIMSQYGHIQLLYGNVPQALQALEQALTLPPPPQSGMASLAQVLLHHAVALCYAGRYMDAEGVFATAAEYFRAEGQPDEALYTELVQTFELHADRDDWETVQTILDGLADDPDALKRSLRGDEIDYVKALLAIQSRLHHGANETAQLLIDELHERAETPARRWFMPLIHILQARLMILRHDYPAARAAAFDALGAFSMQGDLRYLPAAYTVLAEVFILSEPTADEAIRDALERAIDSGRRHGRRLHLARALLLMGHYLHNTSHRFRTRALGSSYLYEAEQLYNEMGLQPPTHIAGYRHTNVSPAQA